MPLAVVSQSDSVSVDHEKFGKPAFPGKNPVNAAVLNGFAPPNISNNQPQVLQPASNAVREPSVLIQGPPHVPQPVVQNRAPSVAGGPSPIIVPDGNEGGDSKANVRRGEQDELVVLNTRPKLLTADERLEKYQRLSLKFNFSTLNKIDRPLFFPLNENKHPRYSFFTPQAGAIEAFKGPNWKKDFVTLAEWFGIHFRFHAVRLRDGRDTKGLFVWAEPSEGKGIPNTLKKRHWARLDWANEILRQWVISDEKKLPSFPRFLNNIGVERPVRDVVERSAKKNPGIELMARGADIAKLRFDAREERDRFLAAGSNIVDHDDGSAASAETMDWA